MFAQGDWLGKFIVNHKAARDVSSQPVRIPREVCAPERATATNRRETSRMLVTRASRRSLSFNTKAPLLETLCTFLRYILQSLKFNSSVIKAPKLHVILWMEPADWFAFFIQRNVCLWKMWGFFGVSVDTEARFSVDLGRHSSFCRCMLTCSNLIGFAFSQSDNFAEFVLKNLQFCPFLCSFVFCFEFSWHSFWFLWFLSPPTEYRIPIAFWPSLSHIPPQKPRISNISTTKLPTIPQNPLNRCSLYRVERLLDNLEPQSTAQLIRIRTIQRRHPLPVPLHPHANRKWVQQRKQ